LCKQCSFFLGSQLKTIENQDLNVIILGFQLNRLILTIEIEGAKDLSVCSVVLFWTPIELVTPNRRKRGSWSEALGFTLLQLIWQVRAIARLPLWLAVTR
jgi:hypothetical protein